MTRAFAFSVALLASALVHSADTIYQSTDKRGNPVFTDQPQPNSRQVELPPINTTPALTPTAPPKNAEVINTVNSYKRVGLGVPSSIPNGLAPTTMNIELDPALQPGHKWQLLLDGAIQQEGTGSSATVDRFERGTHQLELRVVDARGGVVGASGSKEVFVFWPGGK